jgi:hypothetical protein
VGTPTLIGVPTPGGGYTARYLHWGDQPSALVPVLRRIWTQTFAHDTTALATALLARDWSDLSAKPTGSLLDHRQRPVKGLGLPSPDGEATPRHGHVDEDVEGYLEWLYLIHPEQHLVEVYEATCHSRWLRHSLHDLYPTPDRSSFTRLRRPRTTTP